jgi:hypothetical protein
MISSPLKIGAKIRYLKFYICSAVDCLSNSKGKNEEAPINMYANLPFGSYFPPGPG